MSKKDDKFPSLILYKDDEIEKKSKQFKVIGHAGLWYEKFCNQWEFKAKKTQKPNEKKKEKGPNLEEMKISFNKMNWIRTMINDHGKIGDSDQMKYAVERMWYMVNELKGRAIFLKTSGRFVTGLGRSHPVENGFSFHPTLGVPYLPGTSVKGMVRAWATQWEDTKEEDILRIFGSVSPKEEAQKEGKEYSNQVGNILFFDALPFNKIKLEAEIMTPHKTKYYENPNKEHARDTQNPVPIPYLVVASDQPFAFFIAPRVDNEQARKDMKTVIDWLKKAVEWMGAGAKTAVGFGRFEEDKASESKWDKEHKKKN